MAVRGAGAAAMTQFRWSAFVLIACNKGCLPQIDASDTAFLMCRCGPSSSRPDQRGRKVLGFLKRDDIIRRIRSIEGTASLFREVKATAMKDLVSSVMAARGLKLCAKTTVEGENVYNIYLGCEWHAEWPM